MPGTLRRFHASRVLITAGFVTGTLTLGLLLFSLFPSTNSTVRLATIALCLLAMSRPGDAMLAATALVGFGDILGHLCGVPTLRAGEVLVVASLFGWCLQALSPRGGTLRAIHYINAVPVALLGLTAICSAVVWMRVYQAHTAYLSSYLANFWQWVSTQYFVQIDEFTDVASTAVLLESLALYLAVASMCHLDRAFFDRALRMLIVGGAGLGVLSVIRVVEISFRNPNAFAMLRATAAGLRISPQIPDYIAAAAYFGLCWTTALGLVVWRSRERIIMAVATLPLMAGLFLTGSRSAIGAAGAGLCVLAYLVARRNSLVPAQWVIGFAVIAVAASALVFPRLIGHDLTGATAGESLKVRIELVKAGVGVLGTHPVFGVGLDRFFLYLDRFASPQLKSMWHGRLNPHNDFLRMATEFGLVGLSLFLWTLVGSVRRVWQSRSNRVDARFAGLVGGLTAFVLTMLVSNPLMVHTTSYVFWIALGLATGEATATRAAGTRSENAAAQRRWRNGLLALCGCVIAASVPFRAAREIGTANLAGVTYGLSDWSVSADGVPTRLSGAQATLFVPANARVAEFSVKGTLRTGGVQTVQVFVDGRLANELAVGREPQRLRILLTGDAIHARRIDLHVTPTWVPADVDASSDDHRTVGVEVGELLVLRGAATGR